VAIAPVAHAQFTANFQTNIISGVTSNWAGTYHVGNTNFADVLLIQDGGVLTDISGHIGETTGTNSALVTGAGSIWTNTGAVFVGYEGPRNSLVISDGGQVINSSSYIGYSDGAKTGSSADNNSAIVVGSGSAWKNSGTLTIGLYGIGNSLMISGGAKVVNGFCYIGDRTRSSNNFAFVSGDGTVWSNSVLFIGQSGRSNSLVVSEGGKVVGHIYLGYDASSSNNYLLVRDPGSILDSLSELMFGWNGWGSSLVISNGGKVVSAYAYLGLNPGSGGNTVIVSDGGSVWSNANSLYVGPNLSSKNKLTIINGGRVVSGSGSIRYTDNNVLVSGQGSIWEITDSLYVAAGNTAAGGNSMVISNGGQVIDHAGQLGDEFSPNGSNTVRVISGGVWRNNLLTVGNLGSSNYVFVSDGTVYATNILIGAAAAGCGNLVQLDTGTVIVTNATGGATLEVRFGSLILNDGTLQVDQFVMTNSCAQFIRTGGTFIYGSAVLTSNLDADGDGMANGWEQASGLDPLNAADANADNDGDGFSNLQEYLAGTNPTNASSAFRVLSLKSTNGDVFVTWQTAGGRTNVVQSALDMASSFTNISANIVITGSGDMTTNWLDAGATTNISARYYRVRLVP
jgi:T5SS/PEP-CTERM-associated repeat protein